MMRNFSLKVGMLACLGVATAAPAVMQNVVFAQADVRQEDRQQDRLEDHRADQSGRGR